MVLSEANIRQMHIRPQPGTTCPTQSGHELKVDRQEKLRVRSRRGDPPRALAGNSH